MPARQAGLHRRAGRMRSRRGLGYDSACERAALPGDSRHSRGREGKALASPSDHQEHRYVADTNGNDVTRICPPGMPMLMTGVSRCEQAAIERNDNESSVGARVPS